jgi:hypothetical protein
MEVARVLISDIVASEILHHLGLSPSPEIA